MISTAGLVSIGITLAASAALPAQTSPANQPDSAPAERFIVVQPNVKLEVLDWGGTGRSMVLLAGQSSTAHVFDRLARQLRANHHVYGITRRLASYPLGARVHVQLLVDVDEVRRDRPRADAQAGGGLAIGEPMHDVGDRILRTRGVPLVRDNACRFTEAAGKSNRTSAANTNKIACQVQRS